jgi:hypothetical protein
METSREMGVADTLTIHNMILNLEKKGLIGRVPSQPRSIRLLIPPQGLPVLRPATRQRP